MHREVAVEPGDLERAPGLEAGGGEQEATPVRELRPGLDQHPERGRVDEPDGAQVDDEAVGALGADLEQRVAHFMRVVEIELSRETHDHCAVVAADPGDRVLSDPRCSVISRICAVSHDLAPFLGGATRRPRSRDQIQASLRIGGKRGFYA